MGKLQLMTASSPLTHFNNFLNNKRPVNGSSQIFLHTYYFINLDISESMADV